MKSANAEANLSPLSVEPVTPKENTVPVGEAAQSAPGTKIVPKQSIALPVWFGVTVVVLFVLWLMMQSKEPTYNFLIDGDADSVGAQVSVDGRPVGTIAQTDQPGVKMYSLRLQVQDGKHTVEVSKPGFQKFQEQTEVRGEQYVRVDLQPTQSNP